ncbi:hypothetical protein Tco_0397808 [Tanacetum coccineum]
MSEARCCVEAILPLLGFFELCHHPFRGGLADPESAESDLHLLLTYPGYDPAEASSSVDQSFHKSKGLASMRHNNFHSLIQAVFFHGAQVLDPPKPHAPLLAEFLTLLCRSEITTVSGSFFDTGSLIRILLYQCPTLGCIKAGSRLKLIPFPDITFFMRNRFLLSSSSSQQFGKGFSFSNFLWLLTLEGFFVGIGELAWIGNQFHKLRDNTRLFNASYQGIGISIPTTSTDSPVSENLRFPNTLESSPRIYPHSYLAELGVWFYPLPKSLSLSSTVIKDRIAPSKCHHELSNTKWISWDDRVIANALPEKIQHKAMQVRYAGNLLRLVNAMEGSCIKLEDVYLISERWVSLLNLCKCFEEKEVEWGHFVLPSYSAKEYLTKKTNIAEKRC